MAKMNYFEKIKNLFSFVKKSVLYFVRAEKIMKVSVLYGQNVKNR